MCLVVDVLETLSLLPVLCIFNRSQLAIAVELSIYRATIYLRATTAFLLYIFALLLSCQVLEEKIAELEGGAGACCVCTGMAATVTVMTACLKAGDHCVITDCSYGECCAAADLTVPHV
jgi:Cys/Met metabolism PLP-dependent enzyme